MSFSALFPTLTRPLPFPSQNLPYSSLSGASSRPVIVKLGALSPESRASGNAVIARLSDLSLGLERDLARLSNRGDAPPGSLSANITAAANEVEELERGLTELDSERDLANWNEWTRSVEGDLRSLRTQLNAFENTTTTTRARYVALGIAGAAVLGGLGAYLVFKKGKRSR